MKKLLERSIGLYKVNLFGLHLQFFYEEEYKQHGHRGHDACTNNLSGELFVKLSELEGSKSLEESSTIHTSRGVRSNLHQLSS
jgi:hypothetical protein